MGNACACVRRYVIAFSPPKLYGSNHSGCCWGIYEFSESYIMERRRRCVVTSFAGIFLLPIFSVNLNNKCYIYMLVSKVLGTTAYLIFL